MATEGEETGTEREGGGGRGVVRKGGRGREMERDRRANRGGGGWVVGGGGVGWSQTSRWRGRKAKC